MNALVLALLLATGRTLALEEALVLARRNPQIAQAEAAVTQASGEVGVARSGFLPTAAASASFAAATSNFAPQPTLGRPGTPSQAANDVLYPFYNTTAVTITQPLWDFGRTLGSYQAALDGRRAAEAGAIAAWNDVALRVRTTYYAVLAAEALVEVSRQTIASDEKKLELAKGQFEVGTRPRFDVTQAQVDLENARITLIQSRNAVAVARIQLSQAVGQDVSDAALVAPQLGVDPAPDVQALTEAAMKGRPDLRAAELQVAAQEESLGAAKSAFLPILSASGNLGWKGSDFPLVHNWQVGATLSWPFLNGGADLGRIESQRGALDQARAARDVLVLQIRADVEQGVASVLEAQARREAARTLVGQARENLDLAEGRYQSGLGTIIDLSVAQTAFANAQAQEVRAAFDLASARAQLERAVGR
jgi:outer membrane protein TolC